MLLAGARAARWCGRTAEGVALLARVDLAQSSKGTEAAVEQTRGDLLAAGGDHAAAMAAYERAGALSAGPTDRRQAAVLGSLARLLMTAGNAVAAAAAAQRAVQVARLRGAEPERVAAAITLGVTHCQLGDPTRGIAELEAALADARALDDLELVLRGYGNLTYALGVSGRNDDVADIATEGIAYCRRYGPVLGLASTLRTNQIEALIAAGRWNEALIACRTAEEEVTTPASAMLLAARSAEMNAARGDLAAAASALDAAGEADGGNVYALSAVASIRCEIARAGGDTRGAQRIADAVLPALEAADDPVPLLDVCAHALRAAADAQETTGAPADDALRLWDLASSAWTDRGAAGGVAGEAAYHSCAAEFRRSTGNDSPADWAAAEQAHGRLGRPYQRAYCAYRGAVAGLRLRSRTAAAQFLARASELASRLDAAPLLADIDALAELSGLALPPTEPTVAAIRPSLRPSPSGSDLALTPREDEVLQLLVEGVDEPADRPPAVHLRTDRRRARQPHPRQARRRQPHRGGPAGPAPRPGLNAGPGDRAASGGKPCLR